MTPQQREETIKYILENEGYDHLAPKDQLKEALLKLTDDELRKRKENTKVSKLHVSEEDHALLHQKL